MLNFLLSLRNMLQTELINQIPRIVAVVLHANGEIRKNNRKLEKTISVIFCVILLLEFMYYIFLTGLLFIQIIFFCFFFLRFIAFLIFT